MSEGKTAMQAIEAFGDRLNAIPAHVAVLDSSGAIRRVNPTWSAFARDNGGQGDCLGQNYLDICGGAAEGDADAGAALDGLRGVLSGERPDFTMDYPCHSPSERRWFRMDVAPLAQRAGLMVAHMDVTPIKAQQIALREIAAGVPPVRDDAAEAAAQARVRAINAAEPMSAELGDAVVEAHYLAARMLALAKTEDYFDKDETLFAARVVNQWALAVGAEMFRGKRFFAREGG
jgi:hypothetical protein